MKLLPGRSEHDADQTPTPKAEAADTSGQGEPRDDAMNAAALPTGHALDAALDAERRIVEHVIAEITAAVARAGAIELDDARYELTELHSSPTGSRPIARFRIAAGTVRQRVLCRQPRGPDGYWVERPVAADGSAPGTYAWKPERPFQHGRLEVCDTLADFALPVSECQAVMRRALAIETDIARRYAHALEAVGERNVPNVGSFDAERSTGMNDLLDRLAQVRTAVDWLSNRVQTCANQWAPRLRRTMPHAEEIGIEDRTYSIGQRDVRVEHGRTGRFGRSRPTYEMRVVEVLLVNFRPVEQPWSDNGILLTTWDVETDDAANLLLDAHILNVSGDNSSIRDAERASRVLRAAEAAGLSVDALQRRQKD